MVYFPGAEVRPLGPQTQGPMTGHDIVCLHTMVGYLISTDRYFRISNGEGYRGTESHYGVGGKWGPDLGGGLDGKVWAWQDRMYTADANLEGRARVLSIETADNAARPIQPWTPKQLESLARILAWESSREAHKDCPESWTCHREGIPLVLIPDTRWGRRGIGYHRQGCDPWRVDGGLRWSKSYGKDCPTQARIDQIPGVIARARQIAAGGGTQEEDDMYTETDRAEARLDLEATGRIERKVNAILRALAEQSADAIATKVAASLPAGPDATQIAKAIVAEFLKD